MSFLEKFSRTWKWLNPLFVEPFFRIVNRLFDLWIFNSFLVHSNLTLSRRMTHKSYQKSVVSSLYGIIHLFRNARGAPFRPETVEKSATTVSSPFPSTLFPRPLFLPPTASIIILKHTQTASSSSRNPTLARSPQVPTESFFPKICSILSRVLLSPSPSCFLLSCVHTYAPGVAYAWLGIYVAAEKKGSRAHCHERNPFYTSKSWWTWKRNWFTRRREVWRETRWKIGK